MMQRKCTNQRNFIQKRNYQNGDWKSLIKFNPKERCFINTGKISEKVRLQFVKSSFVGSGYYFQDVVDYAGDTECDSDLDQ